MNVKIKNTLLGTALFTIPAVMAFIVDRQGFNLLDDGIWVAGTQTVADGGLLYRDFFTVYGPAKFYLLLPFFWILGPSVHALVVLKAGVAGLSSAFGFWVARRFGARRMAWLAPLAILAIGSIPPRYLFAALFAVLCGETLARNHRLFRNGLLLGLAWGMLSLFGLDMLIGGMVIVATGGLYPRLPGSGAGIFPIQRIYGILAGFFGVLAGTLLVARATGTLSLFVWDTILCPLTFSPHHVGLNFLEGFFRPQATGTVFSQVFTGEHLGPAWPGHAAMRNVAVRTMMALVFAAPLPAAFARRKVMDPRIGSLLGLAFSSWLILLWRSDVAHVLAAFYGTLLLIICLPAAARTARVTATWLGLFLLVVALVPFGGERLWLMTHAHRPSLVRWDRPTAKILMAKERRDAIEQVLGTLTEGDASPTIGWPAQPGLVFLAGRPLATSQVSLLAGSIRDEAAIIADLRERAPSQLILGRVAGLAPGARSMATLAPDVWTYLRSHFFVERQIAHGAEGFQIIHNARKSGIGMETLPLERHLPGTSQLVKNSRTPVLAPGTVIGQEFRVGGLDLHGIVLLVSAQGALPTEIEIEIEVEEIQAGRAARSLALFRSRVPLDQSVQLRTLAFPAVPRTADKRVLVKFSVIADNGCEVRLLWHDPRASAETPIDYYPEGKAILNGQEVDADLFFISF